MVFSATDAIPQGMQRLIGVAARQTMQTSRDMSDGHLELARARVERSAIASHAAKTASTTRRDQ
jgi:hypothetical protein